MAKKTRTLILIISPDFEFRNHIADIDDDFICGFVLGHTGINGNDSVAARLIDARNNFTAFCPAEGRLNLVAVVVRLLHTDDF